MKNITKEFILAGDAIFTIDTPDKGHRTYRIQRVAPNGRYGESFFVKILTGPDNSNDYTYLGKLDSFTGQVSMTQASKINPEKFGSGTRDPYPLRLLNRTLARIWTGDHAAYEAHGYRTHHEGKCGRCAALLTVPESVESGFGPECIKKVMGCQAPKKARKAKAAPTAEEKFDAIHAAEKANAAAAFDAILGNAIAGISTAGDPDTAARLFEAAFGR